MKRIIILSLSSLCLMLSGCDTSINDKVEQKLKKTQHDALSPTAKVIDDESDKVFDNGSSVHGVTLPDISGDIPTADAKTQVLIPVDQFNNPHQTKLKSDALKWQEANLQTSDHDDGAVLVIE